MHRASLYLMALIWQHICIVYCMPGQLQLLLLFLAFTALISGNNFLLIEVTIFLSYLQMILPSYVSQLWLNASFNSWAQRCQSVHSAETVEILTEVPTFSFGT